MTSATKRTVLTTISCLGVAASIFLAYMDSDRAKAEVKKLEKKPESKKEEIKQTWKCYIPSVACGTVTIGCIIASHKLTSKQLAAIVAAGGATGRLLNEYRAKIKEVAGDDIYKEIKHRIAKDHEDGVIKIASPQIWSDGFIKPIVDQAEEGDKLYYEEYSNTWFRASPEAVRLAEYHLNRNFTLGAPASVGAFLQFIGIPDIDEHLFEVGWGIQFLDGGCSWIDFEHSTEVRDDTDEEYTIISYTFSPEALEESYDFGWSPRPYPVS